jgi:glucose-6-phosphate 1-dehydrogenase
MHEANASLLTIFGATGDLAQRMLLPSLYGLERDRLLPPALRILGTARSQFDEAGFRALVAKAIARHVPAAELADDILHALLARLHYQPAALDDADAMGALCTTIQALRGSGDIVYHLSTAPAWYVPICEALAAAALAGDGTRILLEKPIGHDLASAIAINDGVARAFAEERVFRVDHYLGKEGVQNLLALRFGNALFEPLWNARHIAQVQVTVAESIGAEGRDYYDGAGAARDMLQNHLLQLLCLVAMEPPSQFDPSAVRNEKLKVLRSLRPIAGSDAAREVVAGQYTAGAIDGRAVPGYVEELGRPSHTETFIAMRAHVDNWRWSGVPFYLRTGKRMPRRTTEIYLQFRAIPHSIFAATGARAEANALVISLQPEERIELRLMSKTPGLARSGLQLAQVALDLDLHERFASDRRRLAYERLYLDALHGDNTLFVRRDETEAAWQWVDALMAGREGVSPRPYPAGTWGPTAAVSLADRHGHGWRE